MTGNIEYVGTNPRGKQAGGSVAATSPAKLAEKFYQRGWKRLVLVHKGIEVGGIGLLDGTRSWWGDSALPALTLRNQRP